MNDEANLRRELSAALDGCTPNPIPYPALIRRGLARRRHRRVRLAAGLAGLAAVAIITPFLLGSSGGRVTPLHRDGYHVTVWRPGPHSPQGLIALGTLDGVRWRASARIASGGTVPAVCFSPESRRAAGFVACPPLSSYSLTRSAPPVTFTFGSQSIPAGQAMPASFQVGIVRSDVSYLRVRLSDGQVLTLWPVDVLGRGYGRLVAIKVPAASAVLRVTAFSARAELGYAIPFTRGGAIQLVRWLRPVQPAPASQVSYQVGSGQVNGIAWSARLYAGPWGTCWQIGAGGLAKCSAAPPGRLGTAAVVSLIDVIGVQYGSLFCFGRVSHDVSKVVLVTGGRTVRARLVRAGDNRFFVVPVSTMRQYVHWTAFDAAGHQLGAGQFNLR
jgi:hypothetical protein